MLLVETYTNYKVLKEAKGNGPLRLSGLFQKANAKNQNGRVYPSQIIEREVQNYQALINERRSVGELEHPDDPKIHLDRVSHVITDLKNESNGDVTGTLEILNELPCGKILEGLVNSGVRVGISSRGVGSVEQTGDYLVVQEDYKMLAFDIVAEPSTENAFPTPLSEDIIRFINNTKTMKPANFRKALVEWTDFYLKGQN